MRSSLINDTLAKASLVGSSLMNTNCQDCELIDEGVRRNISLSLAISSSLTRLEL